MNIKKIILIILLFLIVLAVGIAMFNTKNTGKHETDKIQVVASNFASYDFLRAIIGDNDKVELTYLLGAGKDTHSYDPTAGDLITIQNADLFVYVGGEMEKWVDKVLDSLDTDDKEIICITDDIETIEEQEVDGAEKEEDEEDEVTAFDEHIWTSPENAIIMVNSLEKAMEKIDSTNSDIYKANAENYIAQIKKVDLEIQEIVDNKVRDRLIFADKMPMQYFMNYYGLKVSAAFSGCSTETEPSASTIAYLENKVKEENIPVILYIELNTGKVAQTIADETGAEALQIQTLHNVSKKDFDNGETWVSLMTRNIDILRKALQ
jgi:zinc transport system substrate-binding protein